LPAHAIVPLASSSRQGERQRFLDVSRGTAMLLVLVSHFSFTYFPNQFDLTPTALRLVGMIASPTFMIINGILIGFLCKVRKHDFARLRVAFTDRGLLLLTIGHALILGSHAPWYTTRFLSITDAVGVCMIAGPWLASRLSARSRLVLGLCLYGFGWVATESWHPQHILLRAVQETAFGNFNPVIYRYAFPLVPWFGLDLASSALGSRLGDLHVRGARLEVKALLLRTAASGLAAAAAINGSYHLIKYLHLSNDHALALAHHLASPFQKTPPSPPYLLSYGAIGVSLLWASIQILESGRLRWFTTRAEALGQTSFFVFVLQFYVYLTCVEPLRMYLPFRAAWPLYLGASVALIVASALWWHRRGYNRFLTVGYRHLKNSRSNLPLGFDVKQSPLSKGSHSSAGIQR
jgi:uncharacterized membrane protein